MLRVISKTLLSIAVYLCIACLVDCADDKHFDVIIIGSGPGGLIAAEYLSRDPSLSVLVLEAGGPSMKETGGKDVPEYAKTKGWTIFDIPGEFTSQWGAYAQRFKENYLVDWIAAKPWLGKLVGGCSSHNGALYFHPPDSYLTSAEWPFSVDEVNKGFDEIEKMFGVTETPSPDGIQYVQQAYKIVKDAFSAVGYSERHLNDPVARNNKNRSFGHPPFNIKNGLRDAPASQW